MDSFLSLEDREFSSIWSKVKCAFWLCPWYWYKSRIRTLISLQALTGCLLAVHFMFTCFSKIYTVLTHLLNASKAFSDKDLQKQSACLSPLSEAGCTEFTDLNMCGVKRKPFTLSNSSSSDFCSIAFIPFIESLPPILLKNDFWKFCRAQFENEWLLDFSVDSVGWGRKREWSVGVAMEESRKGWLESCPVFQAMG